MMSKEAQGFGIEIAGLMEIGMFMAAMVPGYWWVSKAGDSKTMMQRSGVVGAGLLTLAIASGLRQR